MADWPSRLAQYRNSSTPRAVGELAVTIGPFAALWAVAWILASNGLWWLSALASLAAAAFLVRLFMIQHDCGHGSFFPKRLANDWTGRILSVLTFTPYDFWKRNHSSHHAHCGNLTRRGIGDVDTLTVSEYRGRTLWGRLKYRAYRNPFVLFVLGPTYLFLLQHRLPIGDLKGDRMVWISTQSTNLAIAVLFALMLWLVGAKVVLLVHLPIILAAASAGVWLFYIQHQFEHTYWQNRQEWRFQDAALQGSSFYDLPPVLAWLTSNIGVHHVHHLSSRIPFYRLPQVMSAYPELRSIGRLTMADSVRSVPLALWDEERQRLVSFREARKV